MGRFLRLRIVSRSISAANGATVFLGERVLGEAFLGGKILEYQKRVGKGERGKEEGLPLSHSQGGVEWY